MSPPGRHSSTNLYRLGFAQLSILPRTPVLLRALPKATSSPVRGLSHTQKTSPREDSLQMEGESGLRLAT